MERKNQGTKGHLLAFVTILIWGMTFISTKVLLRTFTPIEILFTRFAIGFAVLFFFYPNRLKFSDRRQELLFASAGVSGITLYYLLENIALTMTSASNVGLIVTVAPFFTALLSAVFLKSEKPRLQFYIGFIAALAGVALISFSDSTLELNPTGDLLAILAAFAWAVYSILTRKIGDLGCNIIQSTRRIFFYGLLLMVPLLFVMDFDLDMAQFASMASLGNLLFLGLCASALCFVTWNSAVGLLGAVKTSVYIYLVPVVTVTASVLFLNEPLTPELLAGASLTLAGLWLSETKLFERRVPNGE